MLMASYEEQKRIANDATAVEEAILTGHWKSPIIKGLTYATATRSGVKLSTVEPSAFVLLCISSVCISANNAVLASFNISIDINLEDKLLLLFIEVNVITVNDFNQQYRTLNTATNTLITNYTEQNLEEIWKNQLTVVPLI
jgi:hypothetical protein